MANTKKVLMVVTDHDHIDESHPTGLWFEEFAVPYSEFVKQDFEITVASPRGGSVPIDPRSEPDQEEATRLAAAREVLRHTRKISDIQGIASFDAIFIPGGHGAMFDLPGDVALRTILRDFVEQDKYIASVCHGPAAFVGVRKADGTPLVAGKTITAFTNSEERGVQLDKLVPFALETRLREEGANFVVGADWSDHVEEDGKLITGQNPQSSASIARTLVNALQNA